MATKLALSSFLLKLTAPSSLATSPKSHYFHPNRCYARLSSTSPSLVSLEYADLNLNDKLSEELGAVRTRQHVNPLSSTFSVPAEVPNWNDVFRDPTLPLMVDIGSGSGRFLLWLANKNQGYGNYLGIEIRQKLVKRAEHWVKELALDPHFKKRHHKRRVVQKPLVDSIIGNLGPGGKIFVQSDVVDVAVDMRNQFDSESHLLQHIDEIDPSMLCDSDGWLLKNPMGIRTEREIHAESEGSKIYRRLYQKRT